MGVYYGNGKGEYYLGLLLISLFFTIFLAPKGKEVYYLLHLRKALLLKKDSFFYYLLIQVENWGLKRKEFHFGTLV